MEGQEAHGAGGGDLSVRGEGGGTVAAEALGAALDAGGGLLQRGTAAAKAKTADHVGVLTTNAGIAEDQLILGQTVGLDADLVLQAQALALAGSANAAGHGGVQGAEAADAAAVQDQGVLIDVTHFFVLDKLKTVVC